MTRHLSIVWLCLLLLIDLPAALAGQELKPFVRGSYQQLVSAHGDKPFIVAFWSVNCTYCGAEVEQIDGENSEEAIGPKLGVCAECQESMAESDAEPIEEPVIVQKTQRVLRNILLTTMVIVGIYTLLAIFGNVF